VRGKGDATAVGGWAPRSLPSLAGFDLDEFADNLASELESARRALGRDAT